MVLPVRRLVAHYRSSLASQLRACEASRPEVPDVLTLICLGHHAPATEHQGPASRSRRSPTSRRIRDTKQRGSQLSKSMEDRLDQDYAEGWRPEPGDKIV